MKGVYAMMGEKYLYWLKLCVCLLLLAVAFFGCASSKITMEPADVQRFIDDARDSVALAQEAGAHDLAPEKMARAESLLARSEEAARDKKRGKEAIRLASDAKAEAEAAHALFRQAKAHEKEMKRISSERERDIKALESAQKAARDAEKEVRVYRDKVDQIEREKERELSAARAALSTAEDRVERIGREKERELEAAKSEYQATKDKLAEALREVREYSEKIDRVEAEKSQELATARIALRNAEEEARKAEARLKSSSRTISAMERARDKEIAIHVAREEYAKDMAAELEIQKKQLQGKASPEAMEKVREAIKGWRIAFQEKDLDRYMSFYAPDANIKKTVIAYGKETSQMLDKGDLRGDMGAIFAQNTQFNIDGPSLDAGSDAVRATFKFSKRIPAAAYADREGIIKHEMWMKVLLFREVEEAWKIVSEEWKFYQDIPEYGERR
jgi:ketosteroid isomerase-like protein